MYVKNLDECEEFTAGDGCILRELLHADKGDFDFRYSFAHARVLPGQMTTRHSLVTTEVYYILEGTGIMYINDEERSVGIGDAIYIPPKAVQCISNTGEGDLVFLCVVDPAWRKEDECVLS